MKRTVQVLLLTAICLLGLAARLWNARDVFLEGRIYFIDPDCYSRMTRAQMVASGSGWVIRHHDFENWPHGTTPHTTAPLDWLIVAGKGMLDGALAVADPAGTSVLRGQTLDLSGALIGPLLGTLTCALLGWVGWRNGWRAWPLPALLVALSPVLVHGTVLGRPDHQALLVPVLTLALLAELQLARTFSRGWGLAAGLAWAVALWTSLYEPLVLLAVVSGFWLVAKRTRFSARELRPGWIAFAAVFGAALLIDGWRLSWPEPAQREAFLRWQQTIGELAPLDPRAPLLYRWLGFGVVLAPVGLIAAAIQSRRRGETMRPALLALVLLAVSFALSVSQLRWGYFLGLSFALALPFAFELLPRSAADSRRWMRALPAAAVVAFLVSLWPLASDWDEKLFPEDHAELDLDKQLGVIRLERVRLREVGLAMRHAERQPFLAPWWLSPALSYWSGQPGVAGSSHESLPGIVASARFFLAPDAATAEHVAQELGVKWIVTDESERLLDTSRVLIGGEAPKAPSFFARLHEIAEPRERVSEADLRAASPEARARLTTLADQAEAAQLGTAIFSCVSSHQFYKLFAVKPPVPNP